MNTKILIVDDDASHRRMLEAVLTEEGYEIQQAEDGAEAVEAVAKEFFDLVLMDIRMKGMDGIEAQKQIHEMSPGIPVVIMTAYASVSTAIDALKSGAYDYLTKPLEIDALKFLIHRALHHQQLEQENRSLREQLNEAFDFSNIIAASAPMKALFEKMALVAPTEATVLITGDSGTGKELFAKAIHQNSPRKHHPLVKVNCAALPEALLESELFGHVKGAFTGAIKSRRGRFQLAHKSSIFLDEIGEMTPSIQAKFLRALQEKEIEPVGGEAVIKVDTRVIAATNKNLSDEINAGRFREDLFYRLNVVNLHIPPLSLRREDIPQLAEFFLKRYTEKNRVLIKGFAPRAMDILMRWDWPGNVRELENVVERAVIMARGGMIAAADFPQAYRNSDAEPELVGKGLTPGRSLKDVEREMIGVTLKETGGNRTHAAKILGISRRTLQLKIKEYDLS